MIGTGTLNLKVETYSASMLLAIFYLFSYIKSGFGSEPICSRFHYEEKTLEKMIRQEVLVQTMKADLETTKQEVLKSLVDLKNEREQFARDLESKADDIKQMKENLDKAIENVKTKNERNMEAFSTEMEKIKDSVVAPVVVFKAHMVSDKDLRDNKVIIFSENLLNTGGAYNNQSGVFLAPIAGLYHLSVQICLAANTDAFFGIILNGEIISGSRLGDNAWVKCFTMDAIATMEEGSEVTVKCTMYCDISDTLWNRPPHATSSFAGVLLHRSNN